MGAWIEMVDERKPIKALTVAPHMGAWIEISIFFWYFKVICVAPHMGAWIEIQQFPYLLQQYYGRTPHGCVD